MKKVGHWVNDFEELKKKGGGGNWVKGSDKKEGGDLSGVIIEMKLMKMMI